MRYSIFTLLSLCLLATAAPEVNKRTDSPMNNETSSSYTSTTISMTSMTSIVSATGMPYGTGVDTATAAPTGVFNNGTSTGVGSGTSATTMSHKSSPPTMSATSTSTAGAAPTGVWANVHVKGAVAGAVGVLGLALAL